MGPTSGRSLRCVRPFGDCVERSYAKKAYQTAKARSHSMPFLMGGWLLGKNRPVCYDLVNIHYDEAIMGTIW